MKRHVLNFSASATDAPDLGRIDDVDGIVGRSPIMRAVLERVRRVAATDMPVLITGETGTGKELLARAVHRRSRRAERHFHAVNLAAVPETLAAAELFGYERGAFTGAERLRIGRFEAADHGTLFLDEIGELRPDLQVMLLRVLEEGEVGRLGSVTTRRVDVRLVAATNRDLDVAVHDGRFREDLFYRLNVFPVHLPPLRERAEDIPVLAQHFLQRAALTLGRRFVGIEPSSMERLRQYPWPGNVRQLQSVIECSAVLCDDSELVVPAAAFGGTRRGVPGSLNVEMMFGEQPTLDEVKKLYVQHLLRTNHGNMMRTAEILDMDRRTLYRMVARYQLGTPAQHRRAATEGEGLPPDA